MKWLKYKLFLILVSAIFGEGLAFFVSSASGGDITTDPLVLQQTNRANWEPGGVYFPGAFSDRGSIIARGGNVTTTLTSNVNVGGWTLQNANILGQYTYTNDLTANHPHTVHSPFNVFNNASDSVSASGSGRQVTVNMSWNGALVHPANGYDGPQGGGYPAPVGGIDLFTFDIAGSASGSYLIPVQERQQTENSNERFNPLTDLTVPTNIDTSPRVGGSPNSGSGVAQTDQTGQSGNDLTIQLNRNPTDYSQTEAERLGQTQEFVNETVDTDITRAKFTTRVVKALFDFAKSMAGQNAIDEFTSLNRPGAYEHALETYKNHEKSAGIAKDVKWILNGLETVVNIERILTADNPDRLARAVSETVRSLVKIGGREAGGALGGTLAVAVGLPSGPGAIVLSVGGKLLGGEVGSKVAAMAYDKWFAEDIQTASRDFYTQRIKSGSILSNYIDTATMLLENAYTAPMLLENAYVGYVLDGTW